MLRTILFAGASLMFAVPASHGAEIASNLAYACEDATIFDRIANAARGGDRAGAEAIFSRAVAGKACIPLRAGQQVRVEKRATTAYCVTPFGSGDACRWVQSQEVRP